MILPSRALGLSARGSKFERDVFGCSLRSPVAFISARPIHRPLAPFVLHATCRRPSHRRGPCACRGNRVTNGSPNGLPAQRRVPLRFKTSSRPSSSYAHTPPTLTGHRTRPYLKIVTLWVVRKTAAVGRNNRRPRVRRTI